MPLYRQIIIKCDTCHASFYGETYEFKRVAKAMLSKTLAKKAGWKFVRGSIAHTELVVCPKCQEEGKGKSGMIAVIAGSKKQFDYYRENIYKGTYKLIYIATEQDIAGRKFLKVVKYGTYLNLDNWDRLYDYCMRRVVDRND